MVSSGCRQAISNWLGCQRTVLLLGEVARQRKRTITLSRSAILRAIGLGADTANLRRVRAALQLWSQLSICFNWWHAQGKNMKRTLPPPIGALDISRAQVTITVHKDWRDNDGYIERIALPLPMNAAAQNIALCTSVQFGSTRTVQSLGKWRSLTKFCRKIGLQHSTKHSSLQHALPIAEEYYERFGGYLSHRIEGGRINFEVKKPRKKPDAKARPQTETPRVLLEKIERVKLVTAKLRANRVTEPKRVALIKRVLRLREREPIKQKPIRIDATDENGYRCYVYEQPDGRVTLDEEGLYE